MAKILVVDDDFESVKLVGLMLQRRGYEIVAATSGGQALTKVQSERPDLVILDVMMPDMDGYEVCRRLRAEPATANLPVIMFTAKTQVDDKVTGFQAGADDYLTKPVHPNELASRVETVLLRSTRKVAETPAQTGAKAIGFLGSKGGVGTSTLIVNVGVSMAQGPARGKRIILAEMRSGAATVAAQLGLRRQGSLAQLLGQPAEHLSAGAVEALLEEHSSGMLVLSGQLDPPGVAVPVLPDHADFVVRQLRTMCDYLLLDLGLGLNEVNRRILQGCYHIVVPIEAQRISLMLTQALLAGLTQALNVARHRISVVLINKAPSATTITKATVEGLLQHDLTGVIPPAPDLAYQASERAVPMIIMQPESLIAQQIHSVAEHLTQV